MENGFGGYHPIVNIIYFASIAVFGMVFRHPVTLILFFAAAALCYFRLCRGAAVRSFFTFLMPMLIFVTLINGLFAHYGITPVARLPDGNKMTFESVAYGFVLGLTVISVIMWINCYSETVTTDKFMCVFGKILPGAALVVSMAQRFLPLYRERLRIIGEAQQSFGADYKHGSIRKRVKSGGKILSVLVTWSLENSVEISNSMRARGYGLKNATSYGRYRLAVRDIVVLSVIIILDIFLFVGAALKELYCSYNPCVIINPPSQSGKSYFINELNMTINPLSGVGIMTVVSFAVLCFLPLVIDISEDIRWNKSVSGM